MWQGLRQEQVWDTCMKMPVPQGFVPHFPQEVSHLAQTNEGVNLGGHHVLRSYCVLVIWQVSLQGITGVCGYKVSRGQPDIFFFLSSKMKTLQLDLYVLPL